MSGTPTHWPALATLSAFQRQALATIHAAGGKAYPERGGWWRSEPSGGGVRLTVAGARTVAETVTVQTLRALERRGLAERIENPDPATSYHPGFQLTRQGREASAHD